MKKTFSPWLAVAVGAVSFAASAQAPTGIGADTSTSMGTIGNTSKADKAYLQAQAQCNEQTGAAKDTCLSNAHATYDRAIAGTAGGGASNGTSGTGTSGSAGTTGAGATGSSGTSGAVGGGGTTGTGTSGATGGATGGAAGGATGGASGSAGGASGGASGGGTGGMK